MNHLLSTRGSNEILSSVSHTGKAKTAASLFVAKPTASAPAPKEMAPAAPLSAEQQALRLCTRDLRVPLKLQESQLEDTGLFKTFIPVVGVQGMEENTLGLCLDPAQAASLWDILRAKEPWKIKVVPSFCAKNFPASHVPNPSSRSQPWILCS
jgi:hypothetical protein